MEVFQILSLNKVYLVEDIHIYLNSMKIFILIGLRVSKVK